MRKQRQLGLTKFGKEVKKRLIDLDMSQQELADQLGVASSYLTEIFRGTRVGTRIRQEICAILKLDYDELCKGA